MGTRRVLLLSATIAVLLVVPGSALAQELDLDRVRDLRDKGKVHFDEAANTDLSHSARNKERKAGFDYLTEAFEILDKYCDEHPNEVEALEDLMVEIHQMRYWLRKESPVGLLEDDDSNVRKGIPADWPPKPPDDPPEPAAAPAAPPAPVPSGDNPPAPKTHADSIEEHLKYAAEWERVHPFDLAGIRDLYLNILENTSPGTAEYVYALKKISEVSSRLKQAYRLLRDEDPDTLKLSGAEERRMVHTLSKDLKSREADVRLRAAEYLGLLRSGEAARHLVGALKKEKDPRVQDMILSSLSDIGGVKVTEQLGSLRSVRKKDLQMDALTVLEGIAGRSTAEGKYASKALGRYVSVRDDEVAGAALGALESIGAIGVYGLVGSAQVKNHEIRLRVIRALGATGDGRAAGGLGPFLVFGVKKRYHQYKVAAKEALVKLGMPAVPYLARFMDNPSLRQHTTDVLRKITGRGFQSAAGVKAWWARRQR